MIITKDTLPYTVRDDESVARALEKIDSNRRGSVLVSDSENRLVGVLTDGDFRRWIVKEGVDPQIVAVSKAMNSSPRSLSLSASPAEIRNYLARNQGILPLLDNMDHIVSCAFSREEEFFIGSRRISADDPTFIIAEIGLNHNGDISLGKQLVEAALIAGADCAKFQLRDMDSLYRSSEGRTYGEDLGVEYTLDLIRESSLQVSEVLELMDYAQAIGLTPLCTPWDQVSAQALFDFGVPGFKVASADLTNEPLLEFLCEFGLPIIVSTGMSTEAEIHQTVALLHGSAASYALLHCNSAYPAAYKDLNLNYLKRLAEIGQCPVGYSGHERGTSIPVAAVAMGARIVEKHITLDKSMRGNDHVVSLLPREFEQMVRDIRNTEDAMGTDKPRRLSQGEQLNRLSLSKSLVAAQDLHEGVEVRITDIAVKSPGRGIQPNRMRDLVGKVLRRSIEQGDFFFESDLTPPTDVPKDFSFTRPWGLPVRFHDWQFLAEKSNPDFLEFHLSYRDLDLDFENFIPKKLDYSLVVHSPDLFHNDLILDLASQKEDIRRASARELQRVIDLTSAMAKRFNGGVQPKVVVSLGGSSLDSPWPTEERNKGYERVISELKNVEPKGVELLAQTLPPYPWYMGGQRYCNLFVDPAETVIFSETAAIRICFDVAHTKLACNSLKKSFEDATHLLLPVSGHTHLVDAAGVDGEGLQIDEGDINWQLFTEKMNELTPTLSFIPEIWQGHIEGGLGFWTALTRLESHFKKTEIK